MPPVGHPASTSGATKKNLQPGQIRSTEELKERAYFACVEDDVEEAYCTPYSRSCYFFFGVAEKRRRGFLLKAMDSRSTSFAELIRTRRSIRDFEAREVDEALLKYVIHSAPIIGTIIIIMGVRSQLEITEMGGAWQC